MSRNPAVKGLLFMALAALSPMLPAVQCEISTTSFPLGALAQSPVPGEMQTGSVVVSCFAELGDFPLLANTFTVNYVVEMSGPGGSFAAPISARALRSVQRNASLPYEVRTGAGCAVPGLWGYAGGGGVGCSGSLTFQRNTLNLLTRQTPPQSRTLISQLRLGPSFSAPPATDYADQLAVRLTY